MLLDERLRHVVDEIEGAECTIDVGTDHGKVILTALAEGRTKKGIASDISRDSLAKAERLAKRLGIDLDTRCGDGLSVLENGEADTAVIAGMGGIEIVKILTSSSVKVPRLVLVPHRDTRLVREYLVDNGYAISKDYMVREGAFYYNIIVARLGEDSLTRREVYLGRNSRNSEVYREYMRYRVAVIRDILAHREDADLVEELAILTLELHDIEG